jgi:hypothetical protein
MSAGSPAPPAPQLLKAQPSLVETQTTEDILLTGVSTNFKQDVTVVSFGPDITVNSVGVIRPVLFVANITVASTAATGERDVTATTGTEQVTLSGGFNVVSDGPVTPPHKPPKPPVPWLYSVIVKLDTIANARGGDVWNISWNVDGKLCLMPDPAGATPIPVRIPVFQPDDNFAVTVLQFLMQGADGTPAVLTSPMSYTIPVGPPSLDIKSPAPALTFAFLTPIPLETIEVKGQSTQIDMFGGILMTVLTTNVLTLPQIEAMTGNTSGGVSPSAPDTSALTQEAEQLKASAGDPASTSGAGFQTALTSLMQQATATFSIPASQAGSIDQMTATFQSLTLPWETGSLVPVQKTYSFNQGGVQIDLRVYVVRDSELS